MKGVCVCVCVSAGRTMQEEECQAGERSNACGRASGEYATMYMTGAGCKDSMASPLAPSLPLPYASGRVATHGMRRKTLAFPPSVLSHRPRGPCSGTQPFRLDTRGIWSARQSHQSRAAKARGPCRFFHLINAEQMSNVDTTATGRPQRPSTSQQTPAIHVALPTAEPMPWPRRRPASPPH